MSAETAQLEMVWPWRVPRPTAQPDLAPGYALRFYAPSDCAAYLDLMHAAGFGFFNAETMRYWLDAALPDGIFVVLHRASDRLVATAMAAHRPTPLHPFGGELGWTAAHPEHTGKHLGQVVCAAATARLIRAGYRHIYLKTDDWRLAAIKTYLRVGYAPLPYAPGMVERWQAVCAQLAMPYEPAGEALLEREAD